MVVHDVDYGEMPIDPVDDPDDDSGVQGFVSPIGQQQFHMSRM